MFESLEKAIQQREKLAAEQRSVPPIRRSQTVLRDMQKHSILQMGIPAKR